MCIHYYCCCYHTAEYNRSCVVSPVYCLKLVFDGSITSITSKVFRTPNIIVLALLRCGSEFTNGIYFVGLSKMFILHTSTNIYTFRIDTFKHNEYCLRWFYQLQRPKNGKKKITIIVI